MHNLLVFVAIVVGMDAVFGWLSRHTGRWIHCRFFGHPADREESWSRRWLYALTGFVFWLGVLVTGILAARLFRG
ncbi:hypothetical protein [Thiolapillus brandeum]|nr:hypothetical protein [Thiolapillus brandeum]